MATGMSFQSLTQDLQNYLERGTQPADPIVFGQLPKLINNAERRITRELKILGFEQSLTNSFTAGSPLLSKPDRWRETISFNYGLPNLVTGQYTGRNPIFPRSYEFIRGVWNDDSQVGQPRYWAEYDFNTWVVAPTPAASYPFEVKFWQMPALLDAVNTQNWLTMYAPDLLLYSALMECAPFMKDDPRIATWETLMNRAIASVANQDIQTMMVRAMTTRQSIGAPAQTPNPTTPNT